MFGGSATLPITVLTMSGAGATSRATLAESRSWIAHLPGLKVVMPATPYDVKGCIIAAARDDNPVFVVMNKMSLGLTGEVPEGAYEVPIGWRTSCDPAPTTRSVRWAGCCTRR